MASKLFRAVVGFGIGLGAASAACFGAADSETTATDGQDAATATPLPSPSSSSTGTSSSGDPQRTPDANADVTVVDAGTDAPKDVGVDAFCDAAWPTTKGNPKPPSCVDPNGECIDAGHPMHCYAVDDAGACEFGQATTAPFCVNKEWRCQSGTTTAEGCQ